MLATKLYFYQLGQTIYGPYQKRVPLMVTVQTSSEHFLMPMSDLSSRKEVQGISIEKINDVSESLLFTVPKGSHVEILGLLGWTTVYNGFKVRNQLGEFSFSASGIVRISTIGKDSNESTLVVGVVRGKDQKLLPMMDWRESFNWSARGVGSLLVHLALLGLIFALKDFQIPWPSSTVELQEKLEEKQQEQKLVEVDPAMVGDFDGTGMSMGGDGGKGGQQSSEAKAQAMTSGLSGLANRLSNISFGGKLNISTGQGGSDSKAVANVAAGLSQGQGSGLNAGLEKMAQGTMGKGMRWGVYGGNGQGISKRDQDELANVFRSLQSEFRGCYESALMKDDSLSVTVNYEGVIQDSGRLGQGAYDFSGTSTDEGQNHLTQCLNGVMSKVKVSKSLNGIKIKNQFIFKS